MEGIKYIVYLIISMLVVVFITYLIKSNYNKQNYAHIEFENKTYEFDTLTNQKDAEVYFKYKNIGSKSLKINKIETSCGCTIPLWNDKELVIGMLMFKIIRQIMLLVF